MIRWLLRPDTSDLGPEASLALDVVKAELQALDARPARLKPLFLFGLITSFGFLVAIVLTLVAFPKQLTALTVPLALPYILLHISTPAPLALERLPFRSGIPGILAVVALATLLGWHWLEIAALLWIAFAIAIIAALVYVASYALALADPAFLDRANTVETLRKATPHAEFARRLTDIHMMQVHFGTFLAVLRQAGNPTEALEETLSKFRVVNDAGRSEARRHLTVLLSEFRKAPR